MFGGSSGGSTLRLGTDLVGRLRQDRQIWDQVGADQQIIEMM